VTTKPNKRVAIIGGAVAIAASAFITLGSIQTADAKYPYEPGKKTTTTKVFKKR
jgi:hypothetical protein